MWTTNVSPTAVTGSPVDDINIPELSIVTCPSGLRRMAKIAAGSDLIVRWTSNRSVVMAASCHAVRGGYGSRPEVDMEPTTDQLAALSADPHPGAVVMLNLVRYRVGDGEGAAGR